MEGVRVDGLLLVGFKRHLVTSIDGGVGGLRLEFLDDRRRGGHGVRGCRGVRGGRRCGFGVRGGRFRVGRLRDGSHVFVLLGQFTLDKCHGMTGSQEDDWSDTTTTTGS